MRHAGASRLGIGWFSRFHHGAMAIGLIVLVPFLFGLVLPAEDGTVPDSFVPMGTGTKSLIGDVRLGFRRTGNAKHQKDRKDAVDDLGDTHHTGCGSEIG